MYLKLLKIPNGNSIFHSVWISSFSQLGVFGSSETTTKLKTIETDGQVGVQY
jgi:hypothetical protein